MDADGLAEWLEKRAKTGEFSGVVLVWKDGRPLFEHAVGLAHRGWRVPVRTDTRFQVASVTKMMTAAAVLGLVENGSLSLDTPLLEILPEAHRPVALESGHTIHHLLCHMSGLRNYHDDDDKTWSSFMSCWDRIPTYHLREVADMLPLFRELPATQPPGQGFQYGDANYILIGLVIEAVTGRRYHDVVADTVLGPAGMADTSFTGLDFDPERLAVGYFTSDRPAERGRSNINAVPAMGMPDGGIITSARDLARFFDALVAGDLVSPETLERMLVPRAPINDTDGLEAYGYGLELTVVEDRVTIFGHAGGDPGVSAMTSYFVDEATSVIVLCNQDRGSWAASKQTAGSFGLPDPRE
ncbi:MAG TPA: serine hydrolase domain-containing protein [Acidimicrobiia bacterium]|nr:serine hydrolase domain-containing protein [Acidimicrobiia bacterium]